MHWAGLATWVASAMVAATVALSAAAAPETQPAETAPATVPYSDPTFGFEMRLPAGWRYQRARFNGPAGAAGLLRGENRARGQALQILVFRNAELSETKAAPSFEAWTQWFEKRLDELHGKTAKAEKRQVSLERLHTAYMVEPKADGSRILTHYLAVPFDPNTVWVLVWAGSVSDTAGKETLRTEFDEIATSVRVTYDPLAAEELSAAFERGLTVLAELRESAAAVPVDSTPRFYEILIGDKPIGYLQRWLRRETQALSDPRMGDRRKEGLHVREESWRFADDGTVRCTELDLFCSFDLRSELIENRTTQIPAPDVQPRLYIELDQCVREDKALVSSFSTNVESALPDPRPPIPIGPRYLSLAWTRVLPQMLLKAGDQTFAFAVYHSQIRALTVHAIRPLGKAELPGRPGEVGYAFETRDGVAGQPSRIYTDAQGGVVRLVSGDLVLSQTTPQEIERKYAAPREAARKQLQPKPPASARP